MPSPFPGMDPYLEHPEVFPDFHDRFTTHLSEAIQQVLRPPYYATLGRRVWIEVSERYIGPDVSITRPPYREPSPRPAVATAPGGRAVIVHVPHDERREPCVEIRMGRGREARLITAVEILSPANKTPGEHGRELYLRKQREILESRTNLVEIDLLRGGVHTTAIPLSYASFAAGPFHYHACVHRMDHLEEFILYPIALAEPLPELAIPLLSEDAPVIVSLQEVFDRCYDAGPYRWEVDYAAQVPGPPPTIEEAEWIRQRASTAPAT